MNAEFINIAKFLIEHISLGDVTGVIGLILNFINLFKKKDSKVEIELGPETRAWIEKIMFIWKNEPEQLNIVNVPEGVVKELQEHQKEYEEFLSIFVKPDYIDGVSFVCDKRMNIGIQKKAADILTRRNAGMQIVDLGELESYQETVENFKYSYMSDNIYKEDDFVIEDEMISLNFNFDTSGVDDGYPYNKQDIVKMADALNRLLGDDYIVGYIPYGRYIED